MGFYALSEQIHGMAYSNFSTATPAPSSSVNGALFNVVTSGTTPVITTILSEGGTNIADALDMALSMHLGSKTSDAKVHPTDAQHRLWLDPERRGP